MKKVILFSLVLLMFSGCAFVNTLYNGGTAYRKAQRIERQHTQMSKDSAQTARETAPLYRRAISKADKVLLEYPKSERAHDDAYFLKGISLFALGEYMAAINVFEVLLEYFPESRYIARTILHLARAFAKNEDYLIADNYVNMLLERFPQMSNNQHLIMLRADLAVALEGRQAAIETLERRLAETTDPLYKLTIIKRLMALNMESGDYERAISYTENMPAFERRFSRIYYRIEFRKLQCLRRLYRRSEAIALADAMLKNPAYLYNRSEIMLEKGITLVDMGRYDDAVRIFEEIIAIGGDPAIRCKTWFEYAVVSIDFRGDLESGKEQLQNALALVGNNLEMRNLITRRLNGLKTIAELQKALEEADPFSTIDSTHFRYRIGEEFWLSAQLPDSALVYFNTLNSSLQTPDSIRAKSLYSMAYILKEIKKDTVAADSIFNEIINRYPHFEAAKASQEMLGIPVTLMTRRDSANVEFAIAERIFLDNNEEFSEEAYYAYIVCAMRFPDIEDVAARALFAAAWVVNKRDASNDGVVDTAAVKIFVRLCNDYPESKHCKAATDMMNANEVRVFAEQYTARIERTDPLNIREEEQSESTPQKRRAILPDFQNWL